MSRTGPPSCNDWKEWEKDVDAHPPFHYWRLTIRPEQSLTQRIYIMACLLWSSLHDRRLAHMMADSNPNWSAVCAYYSMVHALRLLWLTAYGSYPTGHADMVSSLAIEGRGAKANWAKRELRSSNVPITVKAFQGWLSDCLSEPSLSDELPRIGEVFSDAKVLRNDSNYESLILAHQYWHSPLAGSLLPGDYFDPDRNPHGVVNVKQEFQSVTAVMLRASGSVLAFAIDAVRVAFEQEWLVDCVRHVPNQVPSAQLYKLMLFYVRDRIERCDEPHSKDKSQAWIQGFQPLADEIRNVNEGELASIMPLTECLDFGIFGVKSDLMR